jgi:TRAP-type mannitol/chloroaromatic compound transport system substrate-binding protein
MTTRRSILTGLTAATATALATPAIAQGRRQWRMVTGWPRDLPGPGVGAQRLADRIAELTEGGLSIAVFPVGELVPGPDNMDAVAGAQVEMAHDMASYYTAKSPAFAFFSAIPLGLTAPEHEAWIRFGGGQALWDELGSVYGIRAFLAGNTGGQLGGWFRREIASVEDLKGLRFRIPGLAGQALARLGVAQVLLPGGSILDALKSGDLDAAEFMGPLNDAPFRFHEGAKICYWPGFQDPCSAFQLQVNEEAFGELPRSHQAAIAAACAEENARSLAEYNARTPAVLEDLIQKGVEFKQFPPHVFEAFGRAVSEVLSEIVEAGDPLVQRIASSYFGFRSRTLLWTRIADQGFANMRLLDYAYPKGA